MELTIIVMFLFFFSERFNEIERRIGMQ